MAHVWVQDEGDWAIAPLAGAEHVLGARGAGSGAGLGDVSEPAEAGSLVRPDVISRILLVDEPGPPAWILLDPDPAVWVNGLPILGGLHVLADRDEIRTPGAGSVYFSTEVLAEVTPLPESDREIVCPRCHQPIPPGTPAVRCPAPTCGVWHHESEEYPCWSYAASCTLCPYPTDSEAGFQWTPDGL